MERADVVPRIWGSVISIDRGVNWRLPRTAAGLIMIDGQLPGAACCSAAGLSYCSYLANAVTPVTCKAAPLSAR